MRLQHGPLFQADGAAAGAGAGGADAGGDSAGADGAAGSDAAAAAAKAAADAAAAAAKGAETYTFAKVKSKDAEGKEVETDVDAKLAAEVSEFAKAHKMSKEAAQAFMDRELKLAAEADAANAEAVTKTQAMWREQSKADKDIGGDKFDENVAIAKRATEKFFPGIAKEAGKFPFLDHPQVLKGLVEIGRRIGADGEFITGRGNSTQTDPAKVLFPSMN